MMYFRIRFIDGNDCNWDKICIVYFFYVCPSTKKNEKKLKKIKANITV